MDHSNVRATNPQLIKLYDYHKFSISRTFYNACSGTDKPLKSHEVVKSANLLFSTLEPSYVWIHCGNLFESACESRITFKKSLPPNCVDTMNPVGSGLPDLMEVCILTEFLLETVSLDAFIDTPCEHLPGLFYLIINKLSDGLEILSPREISTSLGLCAKILSKVQPTVVATLDNNDPETKSDVPLNNSFNNPTNATSTATPGDGDLLPAIPLEKSQSDSKLNKPPTPNSSFIDRSPSPRRRANSGGAPKKNEKKSRKKSSKSVSKLTDLETAAATIAVVVSAIDEPRQKSVDDSNIEYAERNGGSPSHLLSNRNSPMGSTVSLSRETSPALQAQHSMLEKCLRHYKQFYVKLVSERVLGTERTLDLMFEDLVIASPKKSADEKTRYLESLLNSRLNLEDSGYFNQDFSSSTPTEEKNSTGIVLNHLYVESVAQTDWEGVLKISSSLLVELSTFPTYLLFGDGINDNINESEESSCNVVLPDWLKVLVVCACWLGRQPSLQLTSIATLLDLIALSKAHGDTNKSHAKSGEGVTTVVMVPLLKEFHVSYLRQYTNVFQALAHSLWHHLGELPPHKYRMRCVELMHELHHALHDTCDAVEDVMGTALTSPSPEKRVVAFNRFATLWHLGREIETNPRLHGCLRIFDKSLLKMLDNLQLPDNSPLKLLAQSWLLHSLVRGDIARIVDPVVTMLLDPSTWRMSVLHVSIQHSNTVLTKEDAIEERSEVQDDTEGAAKIYAISSVDGNVIYHVSDNADDDKKTGRRGRSKKKKPINPVKVKRIFAVTTLSTSDNGNHYVTERNQFMKELEVPPSISGNRNISVFVNPLSNTCNANSSDSLTEDDTMPAGKKSKNSLPAAELLKNATRFKKPDFEIGSTASFDESLFESANSSIRMKEKKLNKELGSSLDSITNSLDSSSPEIAGKATMNGKLNRKQQESSIIGSGGSREIAGIILKGKYSSNNEFSSASYGDTHEIIGNYDTVSGVPSWTMGDEDAELDPSTTVEEYFSNSSGNSVVRDVMIELVDKVTEMCENVEATRTSDNEREQIDSGSVKRNSGVGVHNLHSHMLLYCGVYDSTRTLYALRTLRSELVTNTRMFLCSAATTGVANSSKNTALLTLLARHRKSVLGRNYYGDVASTKFMATYRSSMYLEVLIIVCLYFVRSYYPNLGQMRLTQEEISGNRQVQLASAELLTLIFSELIAIVRDSGKGFSCYIVDLLTKCKVQKIALHCLVSSVLNMKNAQNENEDIFTFTEEIVLFNDPVGDNDVNKCRYRASDHTEAFQIQLLRYDITTMNRGRYPALGHFSFSNFFKLLLAEI